MRKKATGKKKPRSDVSSKAKKIVKVKKKAARRKSAAPLIRNNGTMTESMFWSFIRSALRNRTRFWKPKLETLKEARRPYKGPNTRQKWEFQCSHCKNWFMQKNVEVNHIEDAGSLRCAEDLPGFVERLFCEKQGLECICKNCHQLHHKKI